MMKKIFSPGKYTYAQSLGLLLGRITFGGLMLTHGYPKLMSYSERMDSFADPFGIGSPLTLAMVVFAEFFCSILIILGLGTRLAAIPLAITMSMAAFWAHGGDPIAKKEMALLYLAAYFIFLLLGPGRFSVDRLITK